MEGADVVDDWRCWDFAWREVGRNNDCENVQPTRVQIDSVNYVGRPRLFEIRECGS